MSQWKVQVFSQRTLELCWESCGKMLWYWRYRANPPKQKQYAQQAGSYLNMTTGLNERQMDGFYKQLGLRSLAKPRGANIRHALGWCPVIANSISGLYGHALVVTGYTNQQYTIVNPCAQETLDFSSTGADSCQAGLLQVKAADLDAKLGAYIWYW